MSEIHSGPMPWRLKVFRKRARRRPSDSSRSRSIVKSFAWTITGVFNPGSPLSANRGVLFEPK